MLEAICYCFRCLVAERLLCLQMNTDGQVQKCIFEVLHRETTNVVVVSGLSQRSFLIE